MQSCCSAGMKTQEKKNQETDRREVNQKGREGWGGSSEAVTADREAVLRCQTLAPSGVVKCIRPVHWEAAKWLAALQRQDGNYWGLASTQHARKRLMTQTWMWWKGRQLINWWENDRLDSLDMIYSKLILYRHTLQRILHEPNHCGASLRCST